MPLDAVLGAQWGDEGKGRILDLLAVKADFAARFSGGDNAGHSITVQGNRLQLHLIPSGVLHPHVTCLLGAGMVINPETLLSEIDRLASLGLDVSPARIKIAPGAHLITPAHRLLDGAEEGRRATGGLGTTRRGIGPAYADRAARRGIRLEHMLDPGTFLENLESALENADWLLQRRYGHQPLDIETILQTYRAYADRLRPYIAPVSAILHEALDQGRTALAEGAQGTLLDLDYGTYPFVTSSHPTLAGALLGLGVGHRHLRRVIGVVKAFQTRVGSGPMPTELHGPMAERLRGTGENPWDEFGTTTGRPRRCGWLDAVLLRYAARINGFTEWALTKLDVLTGLERIAICRAYQQGRDHCEELPLSAGGLDAFEPEFEWLEGWKEPIREARRWRDLPAAARAFIERVEDLTEIPVTLISVGPERHQYLERPSA